MLSCIITRALLLWCWVSPQPLTPQLHHALRAGLRPGGEAANRSCSQGEVEEEGFMKLAELIESIVLST